MSESKKVVIRVDIHDDSCKRKALKAVSGLLGIDSLAMDMEDKKLTIIGDINPVDVIGKLKKWNPVMVAFGPAKEEKKKEQEKKPEIDAEVMRRLLKPYNPYLRPHYGGETSAEEDPNGCVIC